MESDLLSCKLNDPCNLRVATEFLVGNGCPNSIKRTCQLAGNKNLSSTNKTHWPHIQLLMVTQHPKVCCQQPVTLPFRSRVVGPFVI